MRPVPGIPIEGQPEGVVIRLCLWGEARGESGPGKIAVLWVLRNRALKHDTTLKAEALRPWQFSSFNANDPNREKLLTAWIEDPKGWAVCDAVAELFESVDMIDPTMGATHYFNPDVVKPEWGPGHAQWRETARIGKHLFGVAA